MKKILIRVLSIICLCALFSGQALAAETVIYTDEFIAELKNNILYSDDPALVESSNRLLNQYIEQQVAIRESARLEAEQNRTRSVGASTRLLSTETYRNYDTITGKYMRSVAVGETQSHTVGFTFSISSQQLSDVVGVKLEAGISINTSYSYSGPSEYTVMPGISEHATHRIFYALLNGSIVKSTYAIVDTSGKTVSTFVRYTAEGTDVETYSALVASNNSNVFYVTNFGKTRVKNFGSLKGYRDILESARVKEAYTF